MSEYLAIDFDPHRLAGVCAGVSGQRVRVERCFELEWPADVDHHGDPVAAGKLLAGELARLGVSADEVLVSLPRDEVVFRQISVPDVPDEQLPNLVRLQAETRSASSLDKMVLDFLPLPRSEQATARQVLMITIARQRLERLTELMTAAGLTLSAVGISTVATSELVARAEAGLDAERDEAALVVSQSPHRVEIALVRDDHLLFTHAAQLSGDLTSGNDHGAANAATLAEVRRSLGALAQIDAKLRVSRTWVVGTEAETAALRSVLQQNLDSTVSTLEPLAATGVVYRARKPEEHQAQLAGPVGMLLATAEASVETVDLLRPRQAYVRPDRRRLKVGLAIGGVAAVVALAFGNTVWQTRALDAEIGSTKDQLARVTNGVERNNSKLAVSKAINDWENRDVDFLYQLTELNHVLPGTDRVYLKNLRFNPLAGTTVAQIQADGRARSRADVEQLEQRLREHRYSVRPHEKTTSEENKEYPIGFSLDLGITSETNAHVERPPSVDNAEGGHAEEGAAKEVDAETTNKEEPAPNVAASDEEAGS